MSRHTIAVIAAAFALLAVVSADIEKDMKTIFAEEGSTPVGFEATKQTIVSLVNEIAEARKGHLGQDSMFNVYHAALTSFRDVCILDKDHCEHNLQTVAALIERMASITVNLVPYLKQCQKEQEALCA